jgi:hypothetical protein
MRSIAISAMLLALIVPCMALSPVEQSYLDGVKDGLVLGQLTDNAEQYNLAVQKFNDHINQTFGANASVMWLPKMDIPAANPIGKPVHKIDGTPGETSIIQY